MLQKLTFSLVLLSLLTSCANPSVILPLSPKEKASLTDCKQIKMHIDNAESYRKSARDEDRFKLQYVLIIPAVVSIYRMDKAEKAAIERKNELEELYAERKCKE